ncbi:MAG: FAD-dependent oxidoreductase [Hyphomicrobiaceae bacterium]
MRAIGTEHISEGERVLITFEGRTIEARRGETVAAALSAAGIITLRKTRSGAARGLFCGMGVCQECRVQVDGEDGIRACMRRIEGPLTVLRQEVRSVARAANPAPTAAPSLEPDVLVIGSGAAGLAAAAAAARAGAEVLIVDERPAPGGQYYKQIAASADLAAGLSADRQMQRGRDRILRARETGAIVCSEAEVIAAFQPMRLLIRTSTGMQTAIPRRLIVATGAYERGYAVPGWTLPGVMTTGALQTLVRSYRVLPGNRLLIAGNGPLNLQVALEARAAGADIVAVAEAARSNIADSAAALSQMLFAAPSLSLKGAAMRAAIALLRIPHLTGARLGKIAKHGDGLVATLVDADGRERASIDADIVTMGYGFQPSNELLRLLGCRFETSSSADWLAPVRDPDGMTSVPGLYAVGDCATLGGAHVAEIEGQIAGLAAARSLGFTAHEPARLRRTLTRHRRFQRGLWRLFASPPHAMEQQPAETIICRCEDVTRADLDQSRDDGATAIGNVKRATRAGMGPCQGRYCGSAGRALLADDAQGAGEDAYWAARPPVKPVAIAELIAGLKRSGS